MNDNDLERQLRAQAGPREEGYVPTRLPTSPDDTPWRRPSPLMRAAVLVPAVAAGVLAVGVGAAMLRNNGGVGSGNSPVPTASSTSVGRPNDCSAADLTITAEPWGGAAGSRGTILNVHPATDTTGCDLPLSMTARILDVNGAVLVAGHSSNADARAIPISRGLAISVEWSNWCGQNVSGPVTMDLSFAGWNVPATVQVGEGADPVPPCLGEGGSHLEVTPAVVIN